MIATFFDRLVRQREVVGIVRREEHIDIHLFQLRLRHRAASKTQRIVL